ncbi:hypothetical protein [Sedimentitalea nanhaiensis]|nr:hypothetical protein [Sedimentitalea nanhaiensis]
MGATSVSSASEARGLVPTAISWRRISRIASTSFSTGGWAML